MRAPILATPVLAALTLIACAGDSGGSATAALTSAGATTTPATTGESGATTTAMTTATTTATTTAGPTSAATETSGATSGAMTTGTTDGTGETDDPPPPEAWSARRGAIHVHSPFSHDACDKEGLKDGVPNKACADDLRAAACSVGLDFVLLTDHPDYMRDYPFEALLDVRPGDEVLMDGEHPVANRITCPNDHEVLVAVGYESTHALPLGLHHHVAAEFYDGITDADSLADASALVATLQAAGAVVGIAHSEEDDLSATRIVEAGLDAMEWYNPHGNFKTALGGDSIGGDPAAVLDLLQGLLPFMAGSNSGAHPDLVYLTLLPAWPVEGFAKWREVLRSRPITGIFGSDVHQNVHVDPICDQENPLLLAACITSAEAVLPAALEGLISGGTLTMADGDRLDTFDRIFRWLENRVLVDADAPVDLAAIQEALRSGRSYGLFSVFGEPADFAFTADAGGVAHQLGEALAPPFTLILDAPTAAAPMAAAGPQWDAGEGTKASIRAVLVRTDEKGSEEIAQLEVLGGRLEHEVEAPGAYHVEIWVRPGHLAGPLGEEAELAETEYLWLITNPIYAAP